MDARYMDRRLAAMRSTLYAIRAKRKLCRGGRDMAIYAKRVNRDNPIFKGRENMVIGVGFKDTIPVPDDVTLCNGCNENVEYGYLVYLSKSSLNHNEPYDYYCESCFKRYFPKAKVV